MAGVRVDAIRRVDGERVVLVEAGQVTLVLRLARPGSVTLAVAGEPVAAFGGALDLAPARAAARPRMARARGARTSPARPRASGRWRPSLEACPELGPALRGPGGTGAGRVAGAPRGARASGAAASRCRHRSRRADDVDLAPPGAVAFGPLPAAGTIESADAGRRRRRPFLEGRLRADAFVRAAGGRRTRPRATAARRLAQLAAPPRAGPLRPGGGGAAAAAGGGAARLGRRHPRPAPTEIEVADPYDPARSLRVRVDPRLSVPANADRLFEKARRMARARAQIEERLAATRVSAASARAREEGCARRAERRGAGRRRAVPRDERPDEGGPRRFLTGRGVTMLVGRGARENHRLTFQVARPEDLWLHARDSAGAHVILRDPEGRAGAEDVREAAEVAAFYSRARANGQVDVHVTRRKHVQPAGRRRRPRARRALRDRARDAARPRGTAARALSVGRPPRGVRYDPAVSSSADSIPAPRRPHPVATLIATGLGSGYSPVAPGTAGSAVGLLLFWPMALAAARLAGRRSRSPSSRPASRPPRTSRGASASRTRASW